jgi:hypothetical protein
MPRAERLIPWACVIAAVVLCVSELQTMFELAPQSGQPLAEQSGGDRHGYAILVLGIFAAIATVLAILTASRPAALAVAVMGAASLLVFLLIDLPDAGQTGVLDQGGQSFVDAKANPQGGFWLLLIGALGLTLSGVALATLSSEQLAELRPKRRSRPGGEDKSGGSSARGDREGERPGGSSGRGNREGERPGGSSARGNSEGERPGGSSARGNSEGERRARPV